MTSYQGGKGRIGKKIYEKIRMIEKKQYGDEKLPYFEPFCGMCGVLKYFGEEDDRKIYASDYNKDLILLLKAIQKGWKPPRTCTKKEYDRLKNSKKHSAKRGFIGITASYGSNFFSGSYRLKYTNKRDYLKEGSNGLSKLRPFIKNTEFMDSCSYDDYEPEGFLIYCDPPYRTNNLKSKFFNGFDHDTFWETMRKWSKDNIVIISETTAPKDFKKVLTVKSHYTNNTQSKMYSDNLYMYK
jgi:site-specific DNA-adenine methylase